jgi:SulP family sulfate permease
VSLALSSCIAYPSIIYHGELAPFYSLGLWQSLVSASILGGTLALASSYPGTIAYAQSQPVVVIAIMSQGVAVTLEGGGMGDRIAPTLLVIAPLCSVAVGLFLAALGFFRLGNLVRYIPFPVIGGFLAAIGWILVKASFSATVDQPLTMENLPLLLQGDVLARFLPGVCLGGVLWFLQRRRMHWLNVPVILLGSVVLFWSVMLVAGLSPDELRTSGWLVGPFPTGDGWSPLRHVDAWTAADWSVFPSHVGEFATLLGLSAVSVLLSASSIELGARTDINLNRELGATGLGNVLTGLAGGLPGYSAASASTLTYQMNAPVRVVGLVTASICLLVLLFGTSLVSLVPRITIGLVLFWIGLGFLVDWFYRGYFRMPGTDYLVLISVFLVVTLIGFMEGIGIGVAFGLVIFVVKYSRVGVARRTASGAVLHSNVERRDALGEVLKESGDQIEAITLQGYLFFGTANRLVEMVKTRMLAIDRPPLTHLVLDFSLVNGVDASAVAGFTRILQYAEQMDFTLLFTNLSDSIGTMFQREGIFEGQHDNVRVFSDLDRALEWCENEILTAHRLTPSGYEVPIETIVREIFAAPDDAFEFRRMLRVCNFTPGDVLIEQGARSDDLFIVESGQVMISLRLPDASEIRVRTMDAGTVIGELAFYLSVPRSASVIGTRAGRAYRLSRSALATLEADHPRVATEFHARMARTMADKLLDTTRLLSVLKI